MNLEFSFIIPVYNRPDEISELLHSFLQLDYTDAFEIVIVEDGSSNSSEEAIIAFKDRLNLSYYYKTNSGPGDSRNFGMKKAMGNYFIILDSDCILPNDYLKNVCYSLETDYVDCFGGPDAAHHSFSSLQKAINFAMTSFITTGGIRGRKTSIDEFQPRSFNMGLSKKAFIASQGFGNIHPGEDPDLSIRLKKLGFRTKLIPEAYVYHKRRISLSKFYQQVHKFGITRSILNTWYPDTKKITYWLPSLFVIALLVSLITLLFKHLMPLVVFGVYFMVAFIIALAKNNLKVALLTIPVIFIQFFGYGWGFLKSSIRLMLSKKRPEELFPHVFFKV